MFVTRDVSVFDKQQITELEGNLVTALLLVLAVVLPSIGLRSSVIVALVHPRVVSVCADIPVVVRSLVQLHGDVRLADVFGDAD